MEESAQPTQDNKEYYYGFVQTKKVKEVKHSWGTFPGKGTSVNSIWHKHLVTFTDDKVGIFFQADIKELTINKKVIEPGDEITFTPQRSTDERNPDKLIPFIPIDEGDSTQKNQVGDVPVSGKAIVFSMGYAKDIVIAAFEGQQKTLDEYVAATKKIGLEFANHVKENA